MGANSSTGPLSPVEQRHLVQTWRIIMENPEEHGVNIFKGFLEKYNYFSRFEKFNGIPMTELPNNRIFRSHSLSIIKTINQVIESLHDEEQTKSLLFLLGRRHKKFNIRHKEFKELQNIIIDYLRNAAKLSREIVASWEKAFSMSLSFVVDGLEERIPDIP
ncbi:UNVERIFIED_CONTAM: hypothetical protein PYX00_001075 [Menopon gallinae]|uniref:Globin domain-containing protein n=1 Tax=Menopon gallinae TaxID=328185 RepID=A0AAW2ICA7_9NEOP